MRNATLDITKGLGILAVVLGHNWITLHDSGKLFNILFSFHMPLFFFISGVLLKPATDIRHMVIERAVSLLKPYMATLLLVAIPLAISGRLTVQYFIGIAYASGGTIPWQWVPLWFLPHLWLVGVVGVAIERSGLLSLGGTLGRWLVIASILVGGHFCMNSVKQMNYVLGGVPFSESGLPFGFDLVGITVSYYLLGFTYRANTDRFNFNVWRVALAAGLFVAIHSFTNDTIDLNRRRYDDVLICTTSALCGIYILLSASVILSRYRPATSVLSYVGRGSLFILIFHFVVQNGAYNLIYYHVTERYGLASLVSFLLGVTAPLLVFELVLRSQLLRILWMPKAIGSRSSPGISGSQGAEGQ